MLIGGVTMPTVKELRQKLKDAQREADNLLAMRKRPGLPAQKLETIRHLERSARAEVELRQMALEHGLAREKRCRD